MIWKEVLFIFIFITACALVVISDQGEYYDTEHGSFDNGSYYGAGPYLGLEM